MPYTICTSVCGKNSSLLESPPKRGSGTSKSKLILWEVRLQTSSRGSSSTILNQSVYRVSHSNLEGTSFAAVRDRKFMKNLSMRRIVVNGIFLS